MASSSALTPRIALLLTLPPILWAGNAIVGRAMVGQVAPAMLNMMRWMLVIAILAPWAWRVMQRPTEITSRFVYLAILGLLGIGCFNTLQYLALTTSAPVNVTLIAASAPLWSMVVGLAFGAKPHWNQGAGAMLSLVGVAIVLTRGDMSALGQLRLVQGDLFMLLAVALWAVYSWLLARPPAHMQAGNRPQWSSIEFLWIQVLFGVLWSTAASGVEWTATHHATQWSWGVVLALVYIALGPSALAYWAWGKGVEAVGPATAAFFGNLTPPVAAVLGAALLGEWPALFHLVAFAFIGAGIMVSSRTPSPAKPD